MRRYSKDLLRPDYWGRLTVMTNPMPDPLSHNDPKPEPEKPVLTEPEPLPAVEEGKLTETLPKPPGNVFTE